MQLNCLAPTRTLSIPTGLFTAEFDEVNFAIEAGPESQGSPCLLQEGWAPPALIWVCWIITIVHCKFHQPLGLGLSEGEMDPHKSGVNNSEIAERRSQVPCPGKEVWNIPAQCWEFLGQYFALIGHSSSTITLGTPMNIMVSPSPWGLKLILMRKLFYLCCT